jgi:hypothetical protein
MAETASSVLGPWSNFYIMAGSSAGALTGLMFVVMTLVAGVERSQRNQDGISTFSTPTVAHFGSALLVSAILSAPWGSLVYPAVLLGLASLYAVAYVVRVWFRTKRFTAYRPDLEDWVWYSVLPLVAYLAILVGAFMLPAIPVNALFALAAGVLLLIFIGIRNAWDVVTFLAVKDPGEPPA